jgi:hypothetical protein
VPIPRPARSRMCFRRQTPNPLYMKKHWSTKTIKHDLIWHLLSLLDCSASAANPAQIPTCNCPVPLPSETMSSNHASTTFLASALTLSSLSPVFQDLSSVGNHQVLRVL